MAHFHFYICIQSVTLPLLSNLLKMEIVWESTLAAGVQTHPFIHPSAHRPIHSSTRWTTSCRSLCWTGHRGYTGEAQNPCPQCIQYHKLRAFIIISGSSPNKLKKSTNLLIINILLLSVETFSGRGRKMQLWELKESGMSLKQLSRRCWSEASTG